MAYRIKENSIFSDGSVTSISIDIPVGHQSGDLMLFTVSSSAGSGTISAPGGATQVTTQANESGQRTAVYYLFASSSSEAAKTFTSSSSGTMILSVSIWRGVDGTTPVEVSGRTATGTVARAQFPSITTSTNNGTILYIGGWSGIGSTGRLVPEDSSSMIFMTKVHNSLNQITAYKNQITAGSVPRPYVMNERSTGGGTLIALSLKDDGNGRMSPDVAQTYTPILKGGSWTSVNEYSDASWAAMSTMAPSSIGGIPVSSTAPTASGNNFGDAADPYGFLTSFAFATSGVDATGLWMGGVYTPTANINMSGKLFYMGFQMDAVQTATMGAPGLIIVFQDGSANWKAFQLSQRSDLVSSQQYGFMLDPATATAYDSSGTIDWTDIDKIGFAMNRVTTSTTTRRHSFNNMVLFDKAILTGGNSLSPLSPAFYERAIAGWTLTQVESLQSTGQIFSRAPVQIGDGSTKTIFKATASSYELPVTYDTTIKNRFWKVDTQRTDYTIYASSSDVINMSSCVMVTNTKQNFVIHASSSTSASYDFTGAVFVGWAITGKSGITFNSATFDSNYKMTLAGGGLNNCSVTNSLDSIAVTTTDPEAIVDTAFISAGTGHAIEATSTGTFDFVGNTFSGYGADNTTDAAFYNNSGGLITLTIPAGDEVPTVRNGTGASTVIDTPTDNQSVTISGAVAGSRIEIYDITSDTQLYEGTPTFPYTWTDSNPYVADREIRLRVAYVDGDTAKEFIEVNIGTSTSSVPALAYLVNQVDDAVYNANAIDGSAVTNITIDDGTMLLSISSSAETWQNMYAYEMYWLFTSTGIEDLGQSIIAPDTANYLMDENVLKVKNVSGNATVLTGGWGRSVNTGEPLDIIDLTGDPLFASPPHVVPYATGSGVTPSDITAIRSGLAMESTSSEILSNTDATQAKVDTL